MELKILAILSILFLIGFIGVYFPFYYNATVVDINATLPFANAFGVFPIIIIGLIVFVVVALSFKGDLK